jgi:hypothetical protein
LRLSRAAIVAHDIKLIREMSRFEATVWRVVGTRAVVEAAVGDRPAEPFVEEQEQQSDLETFRGETVSVTGTVTLDQFMPLEFAQVVAQLVRAVSSLGEMEGSEDGLVDLLGGPTADVSAAVQESLEQADDAHIVDFDSRISDRADGDGERDAL